MLGGPTNRVCHKQYCILVLLIKFLMDLCIAMYDDIVDTIVITDEKLLHFKLSRSGQILRIDKTSFPLPSHICLYMCMYVYVCMYVWVLVCMCVCVCDLCVYVMCAYIHVCACVYVCVCMYEQVVQKVDEDKFVFERKETRGNSISRSNSISMRW